MDSSPGGEGSDFIDELARQRALCIVRASGLVNAAALTSALVDNGLPVVELAFTIPDVLPAITEACEVDGAVVGAGTVMTAHQAEAAVSAGATFLVTPGLRPEVAQVAAALEVGLLMGALTPTEVAAAHDYGAHAVKIFPAHQFGPRYMKDLHGPFPGLPLVPSGGVDKDNATTFLAAGALAVSCGSNVVADELVVAGQWDEVGRRARAFATSLGPSRPAG